MCNSFRHSILFARASSTLSRSICIYEREIPPSIRKPPYARCSTRLPTLPKSPIIHSEESLAKLRHAGSLVRQLFANLESIIKPGISTQLIDDFVFEQCMKYRVYPSPLGYRGFPKSVCCSVNEEACHGIPSSRVILKPGDLLSVDISIYTNHGVHGDACRSYVIPYPETNSRIAITLCAVAERCRDAGVEVCGPGTPYAEIARAISAEADKHGCFVVPGVHGHGVGSFLHGPPDIIHSAKEISSSSFDSLGSMKTGHVFTIEPCIGVCLSDVDSSRILPTILDDGWTVVTENHALTAQFEHMVQITKQGHSILT